MGRADFLKPGDYNCICALTGRKFKRSQCRKRWDNQIVRKESWEPRHPQDFLRTRPERQDVEDPRTRPENDFLEVDEVQAGDL